MTWFDRFAARIEALAARPIFFGICLTLVLAWIVGLPIAGPANQLYHLVLNSPTTAMTFLLMPLLLNAQARNEKAMNRKLDAIARFCATLARHEFGSSTDKHIEELYEAVGIEEDISA